MFAGVSAVDVAASIDAHYDAESYLAHLKKRIEKRFEAANAASNL